MKITTDTLCILPVLQQVIGIGTILSNSAKIIYDLFMATITWQWKNNPKLYQERGQEWQNGTVDGLIEKTVKTVMNHPVYQFERHIMELLIGIIRFMPIIGSIYSFCRHVEVIEFNQILHSKYADPSLYFQKSHDEKISHDKEDEDLKTEEEGITLNNENYDLKDQEFINVINAKPNKGYRNDVKFLKTTTDFLCILPIFQQVIGCLTLAINTLKLGKDLILALKQWKWKGNIQYYRDLDSVVDPAKYEKVFDLPGYQFERHAMYLVIGFIRLIPVLASIYSYYHCRGHIELNQVIQDPRAGTMESSVYEEELKVITVGRYHSKHHIHYNAYAL